MFTERVTFPILTPTFREINLVWTGYNLSEDSLEKEIVTHSSSLPWKIRGTWRSYSSWSSKESDMTEHTHMHLL